ncbi:MAG: TetR family transcriptional regulator C-terminal domain-containing protein, partial [Mycobacteriaceae bacterium]
MPKLVDHAERRVAIAEAAWRVVLRHGVAGVSVRTVAGEAGLATASLRQAFPTQDALLTFCFELVLDRAAERIASTEVAGGARERAEQALLQVLPLDEERHAEMQVWLALAAASMAHPRLAPV